LVWPSYRKIDETLETVSARQPSFDRGLDDVRSEESEGQGHADRALGLSLPLGERL
jgi:hypothetical protein